MRVLCVFLVLGVLSLPAFKKKSKKILVFSKTVEYRHESIEAGKKAILLLGSQNNFEVDTTENADLFTKSSLKKYAAAIFLCTTGDVLNAKQQLAFEQFVTGGGGFVGIHSATDTEYDWPWYGKLVGAYFKNHPQIQPAVLRKSIDSDLTRDLPEQWKRTDEWYNFNQISPDITVLYALDENSYQGGENGAQHPVAWKHEVGKGRAFYTALGHTKESYTDPLFLNHILRGIQYAAKGVK